MGKLRIILASNHEVWWEGLALLIKKKMPDFEVVDICYHAMEIINKADRFKPEILLLDEEIEGGDCAEVVQRINKLNPEISTIIVVKPYKNINLSSSFKVRAKGYIDKEITFSELESSIRHVAKGGFVILSSSAAAQLFEQASINGHFPSRLLEYEVSLSKREKEVLSLLAKKGTTNKEIAEILHITENTVKAHLSSILEKMQVRNRQQAAIIARERGIVI